MNDVMQAVGVFFSYAVLAVFAQNAVFTRGLGVSRLVQLVGDERTSSGWFALLLCVTQVLVAPLAFYAGGFIAAQSNPAQLRPLVYLACVAVVSLFEFIVLWAARGKRHGGQLLRILPLAAVNSGVLGTVLVERTQSFTLEQSMGFGLGSGLGYLPGPAHHAHLHRRAGAGHLWFYGPLGDPVRSAGERDDHGKV